MRSVEIGALPREIRLGTFAFEAIMRKSKVSTNVCRGITQPMRIAIDQGTPTRVFVTGNMTGEESKELEEQLSPFVSEAGHNLWVDLAEMKRIDSQGLGILVSLTCRSNMNKGKLVFARPSLFVAEVLHVTQLDRFLHIDEEEATLS